MPTANEYSQAILRAQLVTADAGTQLILCEQSGCTADWSEALCNYRKIRGALFCYSIGDYASDTALSFYNTMLEIAGLKYTDGVTPDPNAQVPSIIIVSPVNAPYEIRKSAVDLIDAGGGNWYLPFLSETNVALPTGDIPVSVTLNGESFTFTFTTNFTPPRIYGFASNDAPQAIIVTVVPTI